MRASDERTCGIFASEPGRLSCDTAHGFEYFDYETSAMPLTLPRQLIEVQTDVDAVQRLQPGSSSPHQPGLQTWNRQLTIPSPFPIECCQRIQVRPKTGQVGSRGKWKK